MQPVNVLNLAKKRRGNPRILTYKVNLIKILERMANPPYKTGKIDYDHFSFCARCNEKKPFEMKYCDDCGSRVRHRPNTKKAKYWKGKIHYH